ncbi:MAG: hypothetical protein HYY79_01745, partial [Betaproteobacteria bacterium]|nr:hypothetical protein [Betaproteobacteria bacterium]
RTTPVAPFDAEIRLTINVIDADAVAYSANPAQFGDITAGNGIAFNSGKQMRFGRLRLGNANGSQLLPLTIPIETQYWNGTAFITNTADGCTALAGTNVEMSNFQGSLGPIGACKTRVSDPITFASGRGNLQLSKPAGGATGSVDLTVHLEQTVSGSPQTCIGGAPVAVTGANRPYLQGNWTGGAYDQNPTARATFGVYRGSEEIIYMRENF